MARVLQNFDMNMNGFGRSQCESDLCRISKPVKTLSYNALIYGFTITVIDNLIYQANISTFVTKHYQSRTSLPDTFDVGPLVLPKKTLYNVYVVCMSILPLCSSVDCHLYHYYVILTHALLVIYGTYDLLNIYKRLRSRNMYTELY